MIKNKISNISFYIFMLFVLLIALYCNLYSLINIGYIDESPSQIKAFNEFLYLTKDFGIAEMPHTNIKGQVRKISNNIVTIEMSSNYIEEKEIDLEIPNNSLKENDHIFLKFKDINVKNDKLYFKEISVFKLIDNFQYENDWNDSFWIRYENGKIEKIYGKSFIFNTHQYFIANHFYENEPEYFYQNIEDNNLLIEEYKDLFVPKIYNMVNPQETMFEVLVELYR